MSAVNKIKEIIGSNSQPKIQRDDSYGQSLINRSEEWLNTHESYDSKTKLEAWESEFKDWGFTSNNTEYYWETLKSLSPLDGKDFENFTTNDIRSKIDRMSSLEEKENFFRDNAYTWPSYVLKDLEGYFTNIRGANAGKELERNRLNQIIELKSFLSGKTFDLNPNVSIEAHTEDMVKAYDMGYKEEITIDSNGRVAIPLDGNETPLYTLPSPNLSMEEEFISLNDLRGVVKNSFEPMLKTSRDKQNNLEKQAQRALLSRFKTGEIPQEFRSNVLIDGLGTETDAGQKANQYILEGINEKLKNNMYLSVKDMFIDYKEQLKDLHSKLSRRLEDGNYS